MKTIGQKLKSILIEWGVILGLFSILYLTGLHTEVIGRLQQALLWTNLIQPEIEEIQETAQANYNFTLINGKQERVPFKQFQGKTIFFNFWATWCPPCRAEMPNIHELYQKVDKDKVIFVMLSVDHDQEKALAFLQDRNYKFPIYFLQSGLPPVFQSSIIPTTYVISPQGAIVLKETGMSNYNNVKFQDFLEGL